MKWVLGVFLCVFLISFQSLKSDATIEPELDIDQYAVIKNLHTIGTTPLRHHLKPKIPMSYAFSGYIDHETYLDSRQVLGLRQNDYLISPAPFRPDHCCHDINDKGSFNMLDVGSRVRGEVAGPMIGEARTYAAMEADFWGGLAEIIGLFRLRHAFLYFEWPEKALLIGQYWHPVFHPDAYPDTISFNSGSPIEAYSREPQIRFTKTFDNMSFLFAATSYSRTLMPGPEGPRTIYARNAIMPDLVFQADATIRESCIGFTLDVRRFVPRLVTDKDIRITEDLISYYADFHIKFSGDDWAVKLKAIYAQNGQSFDMMSGYAVHCINPETDERQYVNLQQLSVWLDAAYYGKVEPGIFIGYGKNIGAGTTIIPKITVGDKTEDLVYSLGLGDIDYMFRISPRIRWFVSPVVFAGELEYTRTAWGTITTHGTVRDTKPVGNVRLLLAAFYCF